ncbi:hypothetical protein D1007_47948 [Hordeum vulgare]|nr:hypothetical protein D1007_47948 [Hordeum vulgare]
MIRTTEVCLAEEMVEAEGIDAAARATTEKEAICARILKKWQRKNTRALAQEKNRAIFEMVGLPSKDEEEVSDGESSSDENQIRLNPYYVFDSYFDEKDDKGSGKGM